MKQTTLNKDGTPRKAGSGRKKGSNCYQMITIKQLKQYITEDYKIPVKRLWLENVVDNVASNDVESIAAKVEEKIEYTIS
tara:strand:- start:288 stop:527 length:240 start_codon:yes stop_codon:yes gene_type:complete